MLGGPRATYADLNIPLGPGAASVVERAFELGYSVVALSTPISARNYTLGASGGKGKPGKKRKLEERTGGALSASAATSSSGVLPPPVTPEWGAALLQKYPGSRILSRLSIVFSDVTDLQAVMSQSHSKSYDIIALIPTNHEALQACIISTTLNFDIISFDFEGPHWINKIRLNRSKGKVAAEKEVHFEVTYAPSFHGDGPCENMIYTANRLTEDICTRRIKNIIIASGAAKPSELRSPKDVVSLGYLLNLDETTTRLCIKEHAARCISKADARKHGKTWVAFIPSKEAELTVS